MVLRKRDKGVNLLGEVKADRPFIRHEELMDWLCEEFDKLGIEFKLRTHSLSQGKFTGYSSNQLSSGSGVLNANRHIDNAFSVITERKKPVI